MKKMRCTSCGAELKVDENKEFAVCEHCGSSYKLNEDVNINFKMDDNTKEMINQGLGHAKKMSKVMLIPFFVVLTLVVCGFIFSFVNMAESRKDAKERQNEIREEMENGKKEAEEVAQKAEEESKKYSFNFQFVSAAGTEYGNQVEHTLDDIIESNKNYDRKVTLVFGGESTTDEARIIEIKHGLGSWDKYEVVVNKDADGYINEIKVDKVA